MSSSEKIPDLRHVAKDRSAEYLKRLVAREMALPPADGYLVEDMPGVTDEVKDPLAGLAEHFGDDQSFYPKDY